MKKKDKTIEVLLFTGIAGFLLWTHFRKTKPGLLDGMALKVDSDLAVDMLAFGTSMNPLHAALLKPFARKVAERFQPKLGYTLGSIES